MNSVEQPQLIPFQLPNGDWVYRLGKEYHYDWTMPSGIKRRLTVPKDFFSDGCSVPRILWSISGVQKDGAIRAAALLHDFVYRYSGRLPRGSYGAVCNGIWQNITIRWTRKSADRLFGRVMRETGVPKSQRRTAYLGVRAWGWMYWKS